MAVTYQYNIKINIKKMNSYLQKYSDSEASFLKKRLQQHVLTLYVSTTLAYLDFCQQILVLHPGFSKYLL